MAAWLEHNRNFPTVGFGDPSRRFWGGVCQADQQAQFMFDVRYPQCAAGESPTAGDKRIPQGGELTLPVGYLLFICVGADHRRISLSCGFRSISVPAAQHD